MHGERESVGRYGLIGLATVLACMAPAFGQSRAPVSTKPACHLDVLGTAEVAAIVDGRSFLLQDGREIRLPGIEVPLSPLPGETGARAEAGAAARAALAAMLAGQTVELRHEQPAADRYGRILAHAYFVADGSEKSAANEMVGAGFARVSAHVGTIACAAELFAREHEARQRRVGLWREAYYSILGAENHDGLVAQRGQFTVAEGKVVTVRESGGTIYVNFGRRWSESLTVTIAKRNERVFAAAGVQPRSLANLRVRVRGWMEERNGPRIEALRPEQIEIAER
jgi:endonuclease YncB( thermonuclease family)